MPGIPTDVGANLTKNRRAKPIFTIMQIWMQQTSPNPKN